MWHSSQLVLKWSQKIFLRSLNITKQDGGRLIEAYDLGLHTEKHGSVHSLFYYYFFFLLDYKISEYLTGSIGFVY